MTEQKQRPAVPTKGARQDRLKQALRANLKRRKAQARERAEDDTVSTPRHETGFEEPATEAADDGSEQQST